MAFAAQLPGGCGARSTGHALAQRAWRTTASSWQPGPLLHCSSPTPAQLSSTAASSTAAAQQWRQAARPTACSAGAAAIGGAADNQPHQSGQRQHQHASSSTTTPAAAAANGAASPAPVAVVLGIESSCDDTGVAIVTSDGRVLGEAIATQADIHAQWGGVVPNLARDAHAAAIDRVVDCALEAAGLRPEQLSAIAVTVGPGLGLCLRVGAAKARDLARQYRLPLVSVHHMEAHALVARLPAAAAASAAPSVRLAAIASRSSASSASGSTASSDTQMLLRPEAPLPQEQEQGQGQQQGQRQEQGSQAIGPPSESQGGPQQPARGRSTAACWASSWPSSVPGATIDPGTLLADVSASASLPFPFLCLLVSGGHNLLVLVRGVGQYVQLGTTMDDALGEAYDKVARLLNLELRPHGGAALEALAREGDSTAFKFAVPMRKYSTCDFSYAGLKTSTRLAIEQQLRPELTEGMTAEELRKVKADIAASFQAVAVTHLFEKTRRGVAWARELEPGLRHLVVAGGVACNGVVRARLNQLAEKESLELVLPPPRWCTDNGVMVAWAGIERLAQGWAEPPPPPLPSPTAADAAFPVDPTPPHASSCSSPSSPSIGAATRSGQASRSGSESESEAVANPAGDGGEWIELKPRWPLTSELHPRSAAAQKEQRRSIKKVRMSVPLSDLEPPQQQQQQQQPPSAAAPPSSLSAVGEGLVALAGVAVVTAVAGVGLTAGAGAVLAPVGA